MRPVKFELPKEDLECMRILGKLLSGAKSTLSEAQKIVIAEFLVGCVGNSNLNKDIFKNKGKLVEMGVDIEAINVILDITFYTRSSSKFATALALFESKEKSESPTSELIRNFAYLHNYQRLHITLEKLQNHGVLCDSKKALSGLLGQCGAAKKIVETFEAEAKQPGFKVGLYTKNSAHHEILVLFQGINKKYQIKNPHPGQTPKG